MKREYNDFSFIFIFEGFVEMELFPIFNSYYYS